MTLIEMSAWDKHPSVALGHVPATTLYLPRALLPECLISWHVTGLVFATDDCCIGIGTMLSCMRTAYAVGLAEWTSTASLTTGRHNFMTVVHL